MSRMTREELAKLPFRDGKLDVEQRVEDLLKRLTLVEKFSLCAGLNRSDTKPVPRLSIPVFKMTDGPHGVSWGLSRFRRCTYFPVGICRTASWNPSLAEAYGRAAAQETRAIKFQTLLGPAINIQRSPMCGRTFEYQSEDPYLNARMTVPVVRGTQGERIAACVKHYAANNQETKRMSVSTEVSERALQEIYLPAFKAAVQEADVWSVMSCYNRVNGIFGSEHQDLLVTKLREEWGFRGFVVSDWGAARPTTSTEACVKGGLSLEMPGKGSRYSENALAEAFAANKFTEAELDRNLAGLLRVMILTGLFDAPHTLPAGSLNTPEHQDVARKIAEEGIVLLKNDESLLPLDLSKIKSIAVLGPRVDQKNGNGGGSSMIWPPHEITPLRGIKEICKGKVAVVKNPAEADVAVVVVGLHHFLLFGSDSEGRDNKRFELPANQVSLIQQTLAANPKTIVVLVNGSPLGMESWSDKVPAMLEMWYAGMEGGRALADILFGVVNPSGKLPMTFPKRLADSPAHASIRNFPGEDKVYYDEGIMVGYRHFDTKGIEPLFPFGHGLSYTTFKYDQLNVAGSSPVVVSVNITNTGNRAGAEVVQLYVQDIKASVPRPLKELKGFQKVFVEPGQSTSIEFKLNKNDLAFFDEKSKSWVTEPGKFLVHIGSSSRDIRLTADFDLS